MTSSTAELAAAAAAAAAVLHPEANITRFGGD